VTTPRPSTTSWFLFPPKTAEVQFDEKWAFVAKKQKNCAPDDTRCGDCWDHVALDPESRLVVSLVVGKRTAEATRALVRDFRRRTGSRLMRLMTSDEYPVYAEVIREAYGQRVTPPRTGRRGRPRKPYTDISPGVTYATVHKERENNRVVRVSTRVVFGTAGAVTSALALSSVSRGVNTCFVERHNGTDRGRCSRKVRKTYAFSKDWDVHRSASVFSYFSYNFCWPVRTLRVKGEGGRWRQRTPAMAAGLTDHMWSLNEWLTYPAVQRK
jgi:IS1 family transposase